MLRREALAALLGAPFARAAHNLDRFLDSGAALLLDAKSRSLLAVHGEAAAILAPPGSTLKPFVLSALLKRGPVEPFACPGTLTIGARSFNCSHPPLSTPLQTGTAIAYSCNCFVAHAAERFAPGELAREYQRLGLASRTGLVDTPEATGRVVAARTPDATRLQALGEDGVTVTVAELALAYRSLAAHAEPAILEGLEGAVEFGTAQRARVEGVTVAGKTGSARTSAGPFAWFAGFMPSRAPEVVVAVMLPGRSGGSDAAPVAGRILAAYRAGKL